MRKRRTIVGDDTEIVEGRIEAGMQCMDLSGLYEADHARLETRLTIGCLSLT